MLKSQRDPQKLSTEVNTGSDNWRHNVDWVFYDFWLTKGDKGILSKCTIDVPLLYPVAKLHSKKYGKLKYLHTIYLDRGL